MTPIISCGPMKPFLDGETGVSAPHSNGIAPRLPLQFGTVTGRRTRGSHAIFLMAVIIILSCIGVTATGSQPFYIQSGDDAPQIPCVYTYTCGSRILYAGQAKRCRDRLIEHYGGMKGFFFMQRMQFPSTLAGNVLADIPVIDGFFDHDACIAKECINELQEALKTDSTKILPQVMQLHYLDVNAVRASAVLAPITPMTGPTGAVSLDDAEKTIISYYQPVCNRLRGVAAANSGAMNMAILDTAGPNSWQVAGATHADNVIKLTSSSDESPYRTADNIPSQICMQTQVFTDLQQTSDLFQIADNMIHTAVGECFEFACPPSLINVVITWYDRTYASHCTAIRLSLLEAESQLEASSSSRVQELNAQAARDLVIKCLRGGCTTNEKSQIKDFMKTRPKPSKCPLPASSTKGAAASPSAKITAPSNLKSPPPVSVLQTIRPKSAPPSRNASPQPVSPPLARARSFSPTPIKAAQSVTAIPSASAPASSRPRFAVAISDSTTHSAVAEEKNAYRSQAAISLHSSLRNLRFSEVDTLQPQTQTSL